MKEKKILRALSFLLPQFHPFSENDKWWGKGFTEWTNVAKAKPKFKGHYQPHLPADLGFYDLRLAESRKQQAELARKYGIYGFIYYHYWFNGKLLMEAPLKGNLESGQPDFPFVLCWANENWSRRWDGNDREILIQQNYSPEDHRKHAEWLCENVFKDPRYIKINNKPLFLFYKPTLIPDLKESLNIWREVVKSHGFDDIYLVGIRIYESLLPDAEELGFDATVEWQPDWDHVNDLPDLWNRIKIKFEIGESYRKVDYDTVVKRMLKKKKPSNKHYECIFPSWDNTARRKVNAFIVDNATPEKYGEWLEAVCERAEVYSDEENFIFINAWNEWAEGNHLEPDQKWGLKYLEETRRVLKKYM